MIQPNKTAGMRSYPQLASCTDITDRKALSRRPQLSKCTAGNRRSSMNREHNSQTVNTYQKVQIVQETAIVESKKLTNHDTLGNK